MKKLGIILFTIGVLIQCSIIAIRLKIGLIPQFHSTNGPDAVSFQIMAILGMILTVVGGAAWAKSSRWIS
jgi:hypothetical protein